MTKSAPLPARLLRILRTSEGDDSACFPPTEVFNEGWMLRLVLDAAKALNLNAHPLAFLAGSRWYSEALLESPFRASRRGDTLAEGFTNADGVIGHFEFRATTKAGLTLSPGRTQFVVTEAKMFSNLSAGTRNALTYNQAARNVACMAWAIAKSGKAVAGFASLGFFVLAPDKAKRGAGVSNLETAMEPDSIRQAVAARIASYEAVDAERFAKLRQWEAATFLPFVDHLVRYDRLRVLTWESCIAAIKEADAVAGEEIGAFYDRCLDYAPSTPQFSRAAPIELDP